MSFRLVVALFLFQACTNTPVKNQDKIQVLGESPSNLKEVSGLVASKLNPGYLWALNDSGNPSEVYLLNDKCQVVMTCHLPGIKNRDWEELFIGPGADQGTPYLYVADIGDNYKNYEKKYLYRFKEPRFDRPDLILEDSVERITVKLSDEIKDSESIVYDSIDNSFYLFSKRERRTSIYQFFINEGEIEVKANKVGEVAARSIIAADISHSGNEILLKTYGRVLYWARDANEPLVEVLQRKPKRLFYKQEPQGETIAWKLDDSGFYTLSESTMTKKANLLFYSREKVINAVD